MEKIIIADRDTWPETVSDGLYLPCSICGKKVTFGYTVSDEFWGRIVPIAYRRYVVCLFCFDDMAGIDIIEHLQIVQFVGHNKTIILNPVRAYCYQNEEAR